MRRGFQVCFSHRGYSSSCQAPSQSILQRWCRGGGTSITQHMHRVRYSARPHLANLDHVPSLCSVEVCTPPERPPSPPVLCPTREQRYKAREVVTVETEMWYDGTPEKRQQRERGPSQCQLWLAGSPSFFRTAQGRIFPRSRAGATHPLLCPRRPSSYCLLGQGKAPEPVLRILCPLDPCLSMSLAISWEGGYGKGRAVRGRVGRKLELPREISGALGEGWLRVSSGLTSGSVGGPGAAEPGPCGQQQ